MFDLSGRIAVITGGSGSIGIAAGRALLDLGATVILLGRTQQKLSEAVTTLARYNAARVRSETCDVSNEASIRECAEKIFGSYSCVHILVTCAACPAMSGKFEELQIPDWNSLVATDLTGVFLSCRQFGSAMIQNKYGRIINLTSFHNIATYPYRVMYNTVKSGVEGLSRALAVEWGHYGITVNTVAPGPIITPRTQWFLSQDPHNAQGMLSRTPGIRIGELQDVSAAIAYLASDEARHVNGQQLVIDGGWTKNAWWGSHAELA